MNKSNLEKFIEVLSDENTVLLFTAKKSPGNVVSFSYEFHELDEFMRQALTNMFDEFCDGANQHR